jgi:hypothetical protein
METFAFSAVKSFRHERKFYITGLTKEEIEALVKYHPAVFNEIYHRRFINNIYLDSFDMRHYFNNLDGLNRRLKVRIRWYGDLFGVVKNPALELKTKHNLHVGKIVYPLKNFNMDKGFSIHTIRKVFTESRLPDILKLHLAELKFSLLNRYRRKYFLSIDRKYRITIDTGMGIYALNPFNNNFLYKKADYTGVVLELKYNKPQDDRVERITNYFPFRITRSSKYASGIEALL